MHQLRIWFNSDAAKMGYNDPECNGWILENKNWNPVFSSQQPVPEFIRQGLNLYCSDKNCINSKCTCIKEGLKCCDECNCRQCKNQKEIIEQTEVSGNEEEEADY